MSGATCDVAEREWQRPLVSFRCMFCRCENGVRSSRWCDDMGDPRAIVHVLMRGVTYFADAPTERIIGPFRLAIVGEADPKRWPLRRIRPGDVEGIVYTTPAEIPRVVNAILGFQGVLDAHGDAGTPTRPPPPARR